MSPRLSSLWHQTLRDGLTSGLLLGGAGGRLRGCGERKDAPSPGSMEPTWEQSSVGGKGAVPSASDLGRSFGHCSHRRWPSHTLYLIFPWPLEETCGLDPAVLPQAPYVNLGARPPVEQANYTLCRVWLGPVLWAPSGWGDPTSPLWLCFPGRKRADR